MQAGASHMALMVKNLPASAGDARDTGFILESGRSSGERVWQPTPVFLPVETHGQGGLAVYGLYSLPELDMTEAT